MWKIPSMCKIDQLCQEENTDDNGDPPRVIFLATLQIMNHHILRDQITTKHSNLYTVFIIGVTIILDIFAMTLVYMQKHSLYMQKYSPTKETPLRLPLKVSAEVLNGIWQIRLPSPQPDMAYRFNPHGAKWSCDYLLKKSHGLTNRLMLFIP